MEQTEQQKANAEEVDVQLQKNFCQQAKLAALEVAKQSHYTLTKVFLEIAEEVYQWLIKEGESDPLEKYVVKRERV